jgi:hypothetical protein
MEKNENREAIIVEDELSKIEKRLVRRAFYSGGFFEDGLSLRERMDSVADRYIKRLELAARANLAEFLDCFDGVPASYVMKGIPKRELSRYC